MLVWWLSFLCMASNSTIGEKHHNKLVFKLTEDVYNGHNLTENGVSTAAIRTAELAGLSGVQRAFRHAGRFEPDHIASGLHLWYEVNVDGVEASQLDNLMSTLTKVSTISHVTREPEVALEFVPNDPNYQQHQKRYLDSIYMEDAWDHTRGSSDVTIQIIDGGVHIGHQDYGSAWSNDGENCLNGVDDDDNGYVDDCYGYNFWQDNNDIKGHSYLANNYHGQWAASAAAAGLDNEKYISGIAGQGTKIMPTVTFGPYYDYSAGSWKIAGRGFREAIVYGADMGANISSNSWTFLYGMADASVHEAIQYFVRKSNNIFVAAAGNSNTQVATYPAAHEEVISVAATGGSTQTWYERATFSNYGHWIDIAAPGYMILITSFLVSNPDGVPDTGDEVTSDSYGFVSGTSFSCPIVSGVIALMFAAHPGKSQQDYKNCIFTTATPSSSLGLGNGIINAAESISCLDSYTRTPSPIPPPSPHPPMSPPVEPCMSDIILDDDIAVFVGSWSTSTSVSNQFYGEHYFNDQNAGKGSKTATYQIPDSAIGKAYIVREIHTAVLNWRATSVKVTVNTGVTVNDYYTNQEINGGTWNALGGGAIHLFQAGSNIVVSNAGTNKHVVADAFKLECVTPPLPPPTPLYPSPSAPPPPLLMYNINDGNVTDMFHEEEYIVSFFAVVEAGDDVRFVAVRCDNASSSRGGVARIIGGNPGIHIRLTRGSYVLCFKEESEYVLRNDFNFNVVYAPPPPYPPPESPPSPEPPPPPSFPPPPSPPIPNHPPSSPPYQDIVTADTFHGNWSLYDTNQEENYISFDGRLKYTKLRNNTQTGACFAHPFQAQERGKYRITWSFVHLSMPINVSVGPYGRISKDNHTHGLEIGNVHGNGTLIGYFTAQTTQPYYTWFTASTSGQLILDSMYVHLTNYHEIEESIGKQDPHLIFGDGGTADFRGEQDTIYNFLSSKYLSLNVRTTNHDFYYKSPGFNKKLVHGSFLTSAYITAKTSESTTIQIDFEALHYTRVTLRTLHDGYTRIEDLQLNSDKAVGNVRIQLKQITLVLSNPEWGIEINRKPIYDAITPGYRLDVRISSLKDTKNMKVAPHGILGQSFDADDIAVSGKTDNYQTDSEEMYTTAMAEGAIEGTHTDYVMADKFSTDFKFSRYLLNYAKPRDISKLSGTKKLSERLKDTVAS